MLLPANLDLTAVQDLKDALLAARGRELVLDGSQVRKFGGLGLQLLLAAQAAWADDGLPLVIENASEAMTDSLAQLGAASALTLTAGV